MTYTDPRARRRRVLLAASVCVVFVAPVLVMPSTAAWVDAEWIATSGVGVVDCGTTTAFEAAAEGDFLEASVLDLPLASIADVSGLEASVAPGQAPIVDPIGAIPLGEGAFANPLSVELLNSALTVDLTGVLSVPVDTGAGLLAQYVRVSDNGVSTAAAGAVTNNGAIDVVGANPGPDAPTVANVNLSTLVASVLGPSGADLVDEVSRLDLDVGAVASTATLDGCAQLFDVDAVVRDYLIAGLDLDVESALVSDLSGAVATATDGLEAELNNLTGAGNPSLLSAVTAGVTALLSGVLGTLSIGEVAVNLTASYDFSAVRALLDDTISDPGDLVSIDLSTGTMSIDIAALVDGDNRLNGLPPNHEVLIDAGMVEALENAATAALAAWVLDVDQALTAALNAVTLSGSVTVRLLSALTPGVLITLALSDASLPALTTNSETPPRAVITVETLGIVRCPAPTNPLDPAFLLSSIVCPLLAGITAAVQGGMQGVVGSAIQNLLAPLATNLRSTLDSVTDATTSPLIRLAAGLTSGLLGPSGIASLLVNAQNVPALTPPPGPEPAEWAALADGVYRIAALRLSVLGLLGGDNLRLMLATSSVGPNEMP